MAAHLLLRVMTMVMRWVPASKVIVLNQAMVVPFLLLRCCAAEVKLVKWWNDGIALLLLVWRGEAWEMPSLMMVAGYKRIC